MELLTPEFGLLAWTILCLVSLLLSTVALVKILRDNRLTPIESFGWITFVFLVPFIGSIVYLTSKRSSTSNKYV